MSSKKIDIKIKIVLLHLKIKIKHQNLFVYSKLMIKIMRTVIIIILEYQNSKEFTKRVYLLLRHLF